MESQHSLSVLESVKQKLFQQLLERGTKCIDQPQEVQCQRDVVEEDSDPDLTKFRYLFCHRCNCTHIGLLSQ